MTKVFLSHSRNDLETVLALEQALIAGGVEVWRDQHSLYEGFVKDGNGNPVANAEVSIADSTGTLIVKPVTTTSFGDFSLDDVPGKFSSERVRIFVRLNGDLKCNMNLTGMPRSVTIKLVRGTCELVE